MEGFSSYGYMVSETPFGRLIVGSGLLALLAAGLALLLAWLRGRKNERLVAALEQDPRPTRVSGAGPWPELLALIALLLVPALVAIAISVSRALMHAGLTEGDPSMKATHLAAGIAGQLNAAVLGALPMLGVLPLAGVALALALAHRARGRLVREWLAGPSGRPIADLKRCHAPTGALLLVTLTVTEGVASPLCCGILLWAFDLIQGFSAVAGVDPSQKGALLLQSVAEAQPILDRFALVSASMVGVAAVVAFVAWRVHRKSVARALPVDGRPPGFRGWTVAVAASGCLVGAALCVLLALPFRAENLDPLPASPSGRFEAFPLPGLTAAELEGPDRAERAPLLSVSGENAWLDGSELGDDLSRLQEQLEVRQHNWRLVNPGEKFPGEIALQVDRSLPARRLLSFLGVARGAGFRRAYLIFSRPEVLRRPVLGQITLRHTSSARVDLVDGASIPAGMSRVRVRASEEIPLPGSAGTALALEPEPEVSYLSLARQIVAARRAGVSVALVVAAPSAP